MNILLAPYIVDARHRHSQSSSLLKHVDKGPPLSPPRLPRQRPNAREGSLLIPRTPTRRQTLPVLGCRGAGYPLPAV